jgi:hypothetical protein
VVEVRQRPDGDCDVAVDGSLLERVAVEVVLAETPHGRAILGVVDDASPLASRPRTTWPRVATCCGRLATKL